MSASSQLCPDVAACNVKAEVTRSEYNSWMKLGSKGSCLPLGPKTLVIETALKTALYGVTVTSEGKHSRVPLD